MRVKITPIVPNKVKQEFEIARGAGIMRSHRVREFWFRNVTFMSQDMVVSCVLEAPDPRLPEIFQNGVLRIQNVEIDEPLPNPSVKLGVYFGKRLKYGKAVCVVNGKPKCNIFVWGRF